MSTQKNNNTSVVPFYRALGRAEDYVQAKKLKDIYWMLDYRLPCDIARKIIRDYLFPRDIIRTIEAVEEDNFWTMQYIWTENNTFKYLTPPGTPLNYQIMNLNIYGTSGYDFLQHSRIEKHGTLLLHRMLTKNIPSQVFVGNQICQVF